MLNLNRQLTRMLPMINDHQRNQFYQRMLSRHVSGLRCVDLGFGTGLLTMMAISLGARHVRAYEQNLDLYRFGQYLIQELGLEDRITLINHRFTTHDLMPQDQLIIHEVLGEDIWSEYLYYSLRSSPIPIIPNRYLARCFLVDTDPVASSLSQSADCDLQIDFGIDLGSFAAIKQQSLVQFLQQAPLEFPIQQLGSVHTERISQEPWFHYEINTNYQDLPDLIQFKLDHQAGPAFIEFSYEVGDDHELFCLTDAYPGKSWDMFKNQQAKYAINLLSSSCQFEQWLVNGRFRFRTLV